MARAKFTTNDFNSWLLVCIYLYIFNVKLVKLRLIAGLENNFPAALEIGKRARFAIKSTKVPVSNNNTNNGKKAFYLTHFVLLRIRDDRFELTGIRVHCTLFEESDDIDKSQNKQIKKHFNLYRHR